MALFVNVSHVLSVFEGLSSSVTMVLDFRSWGLRFCMVKERGDWSIRLQSRADNSTSVGIREHDVPDLIGLHSLMDYPSNRM